MELEWERDSEGWDAWFVYGNKGRIIAYVYRALDSSAYYFLRKKGKDGGPFYDLGEAQLAAEADVERRYALAARFHKEGQ